MHLRLGLHRLRLHPLCIPRPRLCVRSLMRQRMRAHVRAQVHARAHDPDVRVLMTKHQASVVHITVDPEKER